MSKNTIVLVTGGNRGLGEGLVAKFLARPNHTVVATSRNISNLDGLKNLPQGEGSKLITAKLDSLSETDAWMVVDFIKSEHGITQLDIVISNAGIARYVEKAAVVRISEVLEHYRTNTIGSLVLFQVTEHLMRAAEAPKFIVLSSSMGSIAAMEVHPEKSTAYGSSKAALNYIICKIHYENEYICAFPLHPGWVQTEMGNTGARQNGFEKADLTVEESVVGLIDKRTIKIDRATRENSGGKFVTWDDSPLGW